MGPLNKWRIDTKNMMSAGKMLKKFDGQKRQIDGRIFWRISRIWMIDKS
jgi:hypothetical protein